MQFLGLIGALLSCSAVLPMKKTSICRAWLKSPGGELPFFIESGDIGGRPSWIVNGDELIPISWGGLMIQQPSTTITFAHYDSVIEATWDKAKSGYVGTWKKRMGENEWTTMEFGTGKCIGYRFKPLSRPQEGKTKFAPVVGRWSVKFAGDEEPAVAVLEDVANKMIPNAGKSLGKKAVDGTFLTTTGDYRYLSGSYEYGLLRLSCFDGAHAFLFIAKMQVDGTLKGDFWSGAKGHDTWTAKRDNKAALPDAFTLTKINPKVHLKDLKFRDLDGKEQSPGDPALLGKCTIIEIFGSWCPNCHDAGELLVELEKKYGPRGLKIVGLAFEATGELSHDAKQVRTYLERHHATYPVLLAGVRDKAKASAALPIIDGLRGYPTFLFVDRDGEIRSVYTGFSGPATGAEYQKLKQEFQRTIEKLLAS